MDQRYAEIVTERPVQRFLQKLFLSDVDIQNLIIISPIMGSLWGTRFTMDYVCQKITRERIHTFIITREPEENFHKEAVDILLQSDFAEVRYNQSLHAKLYICMCRELRNGFALLGSANLTRKSFEKNIEIGMMIYGRGPGRDLLHELFHWGSVRLRTRPESKLVKRIKLQRRV